MEKDHFSEFVEGLALHFGQDKYVQDSETTRMRLRSWFAQVKHLPAEPLEWMSDQIKRRWDYFPRNLSKTMLELWDQWLREHPKKRAGKQRPDCPYCLEGWIMAYAPAGRGYSKELVELGAAIRCGHCSRDFQDKDIWCATVQEIRAAGWEPMELSDGTYSEQGAQYIQKVIRWLNTRRAKGQGQSAKG
ncbi:hypothetical protein [Desulfovermiculus halophilus]|uniref:hypothetical protein n=1 Tax=Desulfovermiculus halophilus TaxID=339722 RepID=UPI000487E88C|nr:hypothetical protein [Desulfovermiculus halophilus]